jgi:ABC-type transporter lipoprotein component MlaA
LATIESREVANLKIESRTLDAKQHILDEAEFVYNFDRRVYFNRKSKKIISVQFAQDKDEKTLEDAISEETDGKEWKFYFSSGKQPPEPVKREIEAALG